MRIIPAYAGKSSAEADPSRKRKDHPRIRGEKAGRGAEQAHDLGSSPHTRGKADESERAEMYHRIIPAYAGKRRRCAAHEFELQDHPRIRGEKALNDPATGYSKGSSPHTRGKVLAPGGYVSPGGIIPAYAGKRWSLSSLHGLFVDHPRIRGEKYSYLLQMSQSIGSSPHTRGKVAFSRIV